LPAVDEFPIAVWERLREQVLAKKGAHLLRYASNRGEIELRKAIAAYLCDFRGANCQPEQIVVVAGMQQAMLACALALINEGDVGWIEDPGFHQARNVFAFVGAKTVPRPIDREGLVIGKCSRQNSPRLIFVTPSHQFPFGVTMSLKRRKALIEFAESRDGYILEDDYNSEFRFDGPPLPCLQGFAAWSNAQIEQGLAKLASAVKQLKQRDAGNSSSFQIRPFSSATNSYWPATAARPN
jgi:GntR family transcriptional regulator / MocR family aminotransferase